MKKIIFAVIGIVALATAGFVLLRTKTGNETIGPVNVAVNGGTISIGSRADFSNLGLTSFPSQVLGRTGVVDLDISNNRIGAIPSQIGKLTKLQTLDASDNTLTGIPAELGQLIDLRTLDLSNNQLTGLPNELGNLKNLKTLDLRGNNPSETDLAIIKAKLPNLDIIR